MEIISVNLEKHEQIKEKSLKVVGEDIALTSFEKKILECMLYLNLTSKCYISMRNERDIEVSGRTNVIGNIKTQNGIVLKLYDEPEGKSGHIAYVEKRCFLTRPNEILGYIKTSVNEEDNTEKYAIHLFQKSLTSTKVWGIGKLCPQKTIHCENKKQLEQTLEKMSKMYRKNKLGESFSLAK